METEIWKLCRTNNSKEYEISNKGRARSVDSITRDIKYLKLQKPTPYIMVTLGAGFKKRIHVLVALLFIGPRPCGMVIDHIDRCKTNNKSENLRYISPKENIMNSTKFRHDILETDPIVRKKILQAENARRYNQSEKGKQTVKKYREKKKKFKDNVIYN